MVNTRREKNATKKPYMKKVEKIGAKKINMKKVEKKTAVYLHNDMNLYGQTRGYYDLVFRDFKQENLTVSSKNCKMCFGYSYTVCNTKGLNGMNICNSCMCGGCGSHRTPNKDGSFRKCC